MPTVEAFRVEWPLLVRPSATTNEPTLTAAKVELVPALVNAVEAFTTMVSLPPQRSLTSIE